ASCSLIIPIICASVKRLFLMSSAPSQVGQTLHHSEGTSGGQVTTYDARIIADRIGNRTGTSFQLGFERRF
ncbi:hypothetical protein CCR83_00020, partial [Rhodobacter veldkampii DSM 11550]|nr:hypothetical protein [Phaeovulum veldkampii DSM 11550]